jgi:hypothetical protein
MRVTTARTLVAFFLSSLICFAAAQVTVTFPAKGDWSVWHSPGAVGAAPETAVETLTDKVVLPTPPRTKTGFLVAHNHLTGNIAVLPYANAETEWRPSEKDFNLIHEVIVKVTHEGNPISSANIILTTKKGPLSNLLTPGDEGEVKFFGVTPGQFKVEVKTKFEGKDVKVPIQIFDMPLQRGDLIPILEVAVASKVDTVVAPSSSSETRDQPKSETKPTTNVAPAVQPSASAGNPILSFLGGVISLALIVGAVYFIFKYVTQNKDQINAQLDKIGVQIPEDPTPATGDPDPAIPSQPAPARAKIEPINLGSDAQFTPSSAVQAPVTPVSTTPRLVNLSTGAFINLVEGDHVVSREPGSPYSFPSDASISRNHASLNFENGVLTVTDLGSTNGTYVNSVRMSSPAVLKTGDQILVGATTLRIEGL